MSRDALEAIATELETLRDEVRERMNGTSVKEESDRLFLQILEITHRLQMIDSILFKAGTEALTVHVEQIKAASGEVQKAVRDIDRLADVIDGVKNVLGIVDTVIDILA